jgi:diacylglycerol kinase
VGREGKGAGGEGLEGKDWRGRGGFFWINRSKMDTERFSLRKRVSSFRYAIIGLRRFVSREHNARIHLVATILVIIAARVLDVSAMEWAVLAVVTGMVWVAEILNTCVEKLADHITKERHPEIEVIKDLAACAVLVAAVVAVVAGSFIFIPKLL